jgi:hypothetical protein
VTSPLIAGRYFFKAFYNVGGGEVSIGANVFPTLVVKASKDPAYISGTLRNSGYHDPSKAGQPIILPTGTGAQIVANGFDYLGRSVSAQAFINSSITRCCNATGYPFLVPNGASYTLFGVAPGTYNITVYAAGFVPAINGATVSVVASQSLEGVDIYMTESVNVTGTVLSETAEGGLIPWGDLIAISPTSPNCHLILPLGEYMCPRAITIKLLNLDGSVIASTPAPYQVLNSTNPTSTSFDFSIQHYVNWDGRIPQTDASYTSGLSWGDYLLQAYVTSYVQLDEVYVHVANETTRTASVIRLIRTGFFNVTVHFKDYNSSLVDDPIPAGYGGTLTVSAYDQQGILRAQNITSVPSGTKKTAVELGGITNARNFGITSLFSQNYGILPGTYHIQATFTSSPSYVGYANEGIRNLYYQLWDVEATIGFGLADVAVGVPMFKGGGILLTFQSIDNQLPPLNYPWAYPEANVQIEILDPSGNVYSTNATQPLTSSITLNPTSAPAGAIVQVSSSGFLASDTSCSLSGTPGSLVAAYTCSISGGVVTATFTVGIIASGEYPITVTGSSGDSASAIFTVTTSSLTITLNPTSAPAGAIVQVSGSGFLASDTSCSLSGGPVTVSTCSISGGVVTATFTVGIIASGEYPITVTGSSGDSASAIFTVTGITFFYSGLLSNEYTIVVLTEGYTQAQILHVSVVLGGNSDATIWMILNPVIDLTVTFTDEGLLSVINSTQPYAQPINNLDATPARVEVFDDQGNFVAADRTYIPNLQANGEPTRVAHFVLVGIDQYYGDPRYVWSGFYDTTDGVRQNAGGLFLYPFRSFLYSNETRTFTVRLWVDGYYQYEQWLVNVPGRDANWNGITFAPAVISVVESLNRASRITGTVAGPDFFGQARPLSWATITLQPKNYTLSSIIDVEPGNYTTSSLDGSFQVWVPEGTYGMGVSLEGYDVKYTSYSSIVAVSPGSDTNMWIWLAYR